MENLDFSNRSKTEKISQKNEEFLDNQKKESDKRENITIEIDGQKIEAVKYYFEYPEQIQKETGILGYERTKIPINKELINKEMPYWEQDEIINNLLITLSGGEYPETCVTHKFGGFGNYDEYKKGFIDDHFFVQKIYDLNRIEKLKDKIDSNYIFNNNGANLDIFNKKTNSPYNGKIQIHRTYSEAGNTETTPIATVPKEILNTNSGFYIKKDFYLEPGNFWHGGGIENIGFGFSVLDDSFFLEYIEKCILDNPKSLFNSSNKDIFCIYLINKYNQLGYSFYRSLNDTKTTDEIKRNFISKINEIAKNFLKKNISLFGDSYNSDINIGRYAAIHFFGRGGAFEGKYFVGSEIKIPIFINHDYLPQLSWGHAKYAHYFNDKCFNFFKFKHLDHLPTKEDIFPTSPTGGK
jgi:hypothetical protein